MGCAGVETSFGGKQVDGLTVVRETNTSGLLVWHEQPGGCGTIL